MVLLNNEEFLTKLTILGNAKNYPSFTVTFKKYDGNDRPTPREGRPPLPVPEEYKCLVRARCKSEKISTVVRHIDVPKFMENYSKIMKSCMEGLRKVKKNKNKSKAV